MVSLFSVVFVLVVLQRLCELILAKRNAVYIRSLGGYEVGAPHYPFVVALHVGFLLSLCGEVYARGLWTAPPHPVPFLLFLMAQGLRFWCLRSLGRFWNTRIFVLPGSEPVVRGPYRFLRHPNYAVVMIELVTLPLAFGAPLTAVVFAALNVWMMRVRIRVEERALGEATGYAERMATRPRFLPLWKK